MAKHQAFARARPTGDGGFEGGILHVNTSGEHQHFGGDGIKAERFGARHRRAVIDFGTGLAPALTAVRIRT
jgi:hypothetical protein